ncbi:hypothetical protein H5V45_14290 [Nocardioides sp. KIGAM211]|uniref:Uncharacterized protein n=1 Tax=Nocardioides luti TaxID=2761101 RepID=A0A7X0RJL8_9ACTN|nr:hypothetical protein [Nocardioides luti]MBB6628490.1 hypothetical protein [Nocardioides luti]
MEFTEILATLRRRWRWGVSAGAVVVVALVTYALLMPTGRVAGVWQDYQVTVIFVPTAATPTASADATAYIQGEMYTFAQVALSREVQARAYEESGIDRSDTRLGGVTLTYGGDDNYQLIAGSNDATLARDFLEAWAEQTTETINTTIVPDEKNPAVEARQLGEPELSYDPTQTTSGTARTLALPLAPVLGLTVGIGACFVGETRARRRERRPDPTD